MRWGSCMSILLLLIRTSVVEDAHSRHEWTFDRLDDLLSWACAEQIRVSAQGVLLSGNSVVVEFEAVGSMCGDGPRRPARGFP